MKKILLIFVFCFLTSDICPLVSIVCYAEDRDSVRFDQVVESKNRGSIFSARTWIKGENIRMEYIDSGKPMVSIVSEGAISNYDPDEKRGAKLPVETGQNFVGIEIMQSEEYLREFLDLMEAEIKEKKVIEGKECVLYSYKDDDRNIVHEIWVWEKYFFPIKAIMNLLKEQDVITVNYRNIKIDPEIKEDFFTVPVDVVIQDFSNW